MRKLILAAGAAATLVAPTAAMAANGHKAPAKGTAVKVCVSKAKHGYKARVSAKCKRGEKSLTVHLPAGATGATGATGPQGAAGATGAAGSFVVKDANGAIVGTLVGYDGYQGYVMFSNGIVEPIAMSTGQVNDTDQVIYASNDCTGPAYVWGGAQSAQSPFAVPGQNTAGSPLYTTGATDQNFVVGSIDDGSGCQNVTGTGYSVQPASLLAPSGYTQPANSAGPLTFAKQ